MGQEFDPYLQWLGISKNEPRPINAYRLLGVDKFESDPDVIAMNGDKQIEHLRKFSTGPQGDLAEKLINTLIKAKLTLLKPDRKAAYDQQLRAALQPAAAVVAGSTVPAAPPRRMAPGPAVHGAAAPASSVEFNDPANWDLGSITNAAPPPAMAPAMMATPVRAVVAPSAPVEGLNFASFGAAPASYATSKGALPAKPGKSLTPWIILAASLAACVALTLVLINRHSGDEPVANKDPVTIPEPTTKNNTKTNPNNSTPNLPAKSTAANNTPAKNTPDSEQNGAGTDPDDSTNSTTNPEPETKPSDPTPEENPPAKPPSKSPGKSTKSPGKSSSKNPPSKSVANGAPFKWPPLTNPNEPQSVSIVGQNDQNVTAYRYPGTNPRMATIVSRGHTASRWNVEQDELTLCMGASANEFLLFGDPTWSTYVFECEVYADAVNMVTPTGLLFRCADDEVFTIFQHSHASEKSFLQNWSPDLQTFDAARDLQGQSINFKRDMYLMPRQWKKYSVTVVDDNVTAKRDTTTIFQEKIKMPANGRVGLKFHAYADTKVRVRNIRVTGREGKILWEGPPELPPSLAKAETRLLAKDNLRNWTHYPKPERPGSWILDQGVLYGESRNNPPMLVVKDQIYENFYLEMKFRKLIGECDVLLRFEGGHEELRDQRGYRLHIGNVSKADFANPEQLMTLQVALASDGLQMRLNGVTKAQKLFPAGAEALQGGIGIDLVKPGSEIQVQDIVVRKLPKNFKLFETRNGPLLGENTTVAANNPPAKNPLNNNPVNNNPGMPPAINPDLLPRNSALGDLAQKDEDVKKFLDELNKARELANTKIKKFEEDYLKAFDVELNRVRNTNTLNVNDRAELLQVLTEDKKDFETKKRFSLTHGMLPKNSMIGLILIERQKLERMYVLMTDRMLKEKRDDVVLALKRAREEDPDLRPIKIFSVNYYHYQNSTPMVYDFMGDKTVNVEKRDNLNGTKIMVNNPAITWNIDSEKRLNFAGPLMYDRMSIEQIQITLDGRRLINGKSSTTSTIKSGTIIVD